MSTINVNVTKVEREVTINATPNVTQIIVTTQSGGGGGIPDAPNNSNSYVRSALSWVVGYTKTAIDTLLNGKVDKVNGKSLINDTEISRLASMTAVFTTDLKNAYDNAVNWITTNGTNILNHIASTSNPHSVTKAQVGLSNVPNTDTTTTANITDSTNKRFVTDTNLTTIGNTSGTNSGDNAVNSLYSGLATSKADVDGTFPMRFQFSSSSPLDNTTYYVGGSNNLILSTTNNRFVYAGITATSFRVSIFLYNTGTLGTSENSTIKLLNVTQGTNIVLTTTAKFNSTSYGFVGNFTFAITEGDSLALEINCPAFATNPTNVIGGANLILKK